MAALVTRNEEEQRYEIRSDGELAGFVTFGERDQLIAFKHTESFPEFAGQGLATTLVEEALDDAERRGLGVLPFCPFVSAYIRDNPSRIALVPEQQRAKFGLDDISAAS